jgi:hypothetical protein
MRKFTLLLVIVFIGLSVFILSIFGIPYGSYEPTIKVQSIEFVSNEEVKIRSATIDGKKTKFVEFQGPLPCVMALTYQINPSNATNQKVVFSLIGGEPFPAEVNKEGVVVITQPYYFKIRVASLEDTQIYDEVSFRYKS